MNNEKVYIDGYVVGLFADTLGMKGKRIQLANGDIVDIDDNFIHKSIEPKKVEIPQFVADYIEFQKKNNFHVYGAMRVIEDHYDKRVPEWFYEKNIEKFALAWIFGYKVEEEKRYLVKVKGLLKANEVLNYKINEGKWVISSGVESTFYRTKHTRKQLEEASFGWVFDCEGIEIEEVTE